MQISNMGGRSVRNVEQKIKTFKKKGNKKKDFWKKDLRQNFQGNDLPKTKS